MNRDYMMKKENVFPVIRNRKAFLIGDIPVYHPDSAKYLQFWKAQKKQCIEGFWAIDAKPNDIEQRYRYMPPNLYFYCNFGTILHKPDDAPRTAPKKKIRPHLTDIEWAFFYNFMEARGFSGFKDDDEYSCNEDIPKYEKDEILDIEVHKTCFKSDGTLKTYIPCRSYIRKLWDGPMGIPMYQNEAKNIMLLAARGLGKSYLVAVGIVLFEIIFDGAREYNEESMQNPSVAEVFVGAALSGKSSDLLTKMRDAYENLPGVWAKGTDNERPSPFYKDMSGTLSPNNQKNPWRHEYEKKVAGKWQKYGSKSHIYHGIWTTENPEAVAGSRPGLIIAEELGLISNILTIHGSNDAAQRTNGTDKFGTSIYIGTGGNIEKIVEAEIMFRDPRVYDMLAFDDDWENSGELGWFISATYGDRKFKDDNGNTRLVEAEAAYAKRREEKKQAKSKKGLDLEMMNYPLVPSEMFLNIGKNIFPIADLKNRYADLLTRKDELAATWKGFFYLDGTGKVEWKDEAVTPIYSFPLRAGDDNHGCVHIFEKAQKGADGSIPYGRYIGGYDPVDDDDSSDITRSLQSFWILDTFTDKLVLEYTARTHHASQFYEQVRRACMHYNCVVNYENQKKGFYGYMKNKNSLHYIADTPEILKDYDMQKSAGLGNKSKGTSANEAVNRWGIELQIEWMESLSNSVEGATNLSFIRSPAYLRECILYDPKGNYDRISSMGLLMIYREEVLRRTLAMKRRAEVKVETFGDKMLEDFERYKVRMRHNAEPFSRNRPTQYR
jgi:hypothetical protein